MEKEIKTNEVVYIKNILNDYENVSKILEKFISEGKIVIAEVYQYELNEMLRLKMYDVIDKVFKDCDVVRLIHNPKDVCVENGSYYKEFMANQEDLRFMAHSDKHIISKELKQIESLRTKISGLIEKEPKGFDEKITEIQTQIERIKLNINMINSEIKGVDYKEFQNGLKGEMVSIKADY